MTTVFTSSHPAVTQFALSSVEVTLISENNSQKEINLHLFDCPFQLIFLMDLF